MGISLTLFSLQEHKATSKAIKYKVFKGFSIFYNWHKTIYQVKLSQIS